MSKWSIHDLRAAIMEGSKYITKQVGSKRMSKCSMGLILGSGLGSFADCLEDTVVMDYKDIPKWPQSTVAGHAGLLVVGHLPGQEDIYVMTMKGRKHYYECLDMSLVTLPVRIFAELGMKVMFTTNAVGGINKSFDIGDFMIITDHINMMPNACLGPNLSEYGARFHDMSSAYDPEFRDLVKQAAKKLQIDVREGVYLGLTGPSYETPAEIRMFRIWGADAVGMSTTPEIIVGAHSGLRCVGVSCVTNMAAGVLEGVKLDHEHVEEVAQKRKPYFIKLLHESLVQIHAAFIKEARDDDIKANV